jgi:hypothetical protein
MTDKSNQVPQRRTRDKSMYPTALPKRVGMHGQSRDTSLRTMLQNHFHFERRAALMTSHNRPISLSELIDWDFQ